MSLAEPLLDPALLHHLTPEERRRYRAYLLRRTLDGDDYEAWLRLVLPDYSKAALAEHHHQFWRWVYRIEPGEALHPFVGLWARGGAKSSSAEMAVVNLGARGKRRYVLYVSGTQEQADKHVETIGSMLESPELARAYPGMADRLLGKFGHSRGWRRNRLRTASGFTVDAVGLDTGARGVKVEDQRPDLIVIDDVDEEHDTLATVEKKITTLTTKVFPLGSPDAVVLAIQNVIHLRSIFARLAGIAEDDQGQPLGADFLALREVSGPIPAIRNLDVEQQGERWVIVGGTPTWPEGQGIEVCQHQMDQYGYTAFLTEAQHAVHRKTGGIFDHVIPGIKRVAWDEVPWGAMVRIAVWIDPAVTDTDQSDAMGIQCDGITRNGVLYRLRSWEHQGSPLNAVKLGLAWAIELGADKLGIETDQGGDTWQSVYREAQRALNADLANERGDTAWHPDYAAAIGRLHERGTTKVNQWPRYAWEKAGAGHGSKVARARTMLGALYEAPNRVVHVRPANVTLEASLLRGFVEKPYDLLDASFYSWADLAGRLRSRGQSRTPATSRLPPTPIAGG